MDENNKYLKEFEEALKNKSVGFHTKNIYYVKSLSDYMKEDKIIPTSTFTSYNKRGFNDLIPFFQFVSKYKDLNKKPILLQISYFLSYNLNVYGINNELDKK